jgi:hypothetical protein
MTFFKELSSVVQFCIAVVRVGFGPETNLLDSYNMLLFDILFFFPFLFVQIFAEIHNPADRRPAVRRDFYQVKVCLSRMLHRFINAYYANLFVLGVNQTNRAYSNLLINSKFQLSDFLTLPF